ncbi:MAG: TIGR02206 family membrane protein [Clostridia bacterium]|nr:TIGR02206 family membrane protein [Clostridia bacterium]
MQWVMLILWCALARYGAGPGRRRLTALVLCCGLGLSMGCQLYLLYLDDQLSLQTGLPLHLCGLSALLCIALCIRFHQPVFEFLLLLGLPGALLALCFPAVAASSCPQLMKAAFLRLHVLIAATAVFLLAQQKPPPEDPRRAFLLGNGFVLMAALANQLTGSNYFFLRAAPAGTPLAFLIRPGYGVYLASLEILSMLLMQQLCRLYRRLYLRK